MKKIVSLLCVIAMMFTFFAFSASAEGNSLDFVTRTTADGIEIDVVFETTYTEVYSIGLYIDMTEALNAGATVTSAPNTALNAGLKSKYTASKKYVSVTYADTNYNTLESGVLATIKVTGATQDFALKMATSKLTSINNGTTDVTSEFAIAWPTITLAPAGGEDKGYKELAADVEVATGWTVDGKETDWEAGTGFKATFDVPAALNSMKWAATIDGTKMYSKYYDLTGFAGIEVGSPVVLYGAFTNGAREDNAYGKNDDIKVVEDAGIILKDADGVFYASEGAIAE